MSVQHILHCVIGITLEQFSDESGILANFVHLEKENPILVGPGTAMAEVVRVVCGMLYADHACIASSSAEGFVTITAGVRCGGVRDLWPSYVPALHSVQ